MECSECGASLPEGRGCKDLFHDLLALEWQVPGGPGLDAHFFAVASYNLQHPSLFEPEMLVALRETLADVLAGRTTVAEARQRARDATDGETRVLARGEPRSRPHGWPTRWSMTIRDVYDVRPDQYVAVARRWAESVVAA